MPASAKLAFLFWENVSLWAVAQFLPISITNIEIKV